MEQCIAIKTDGDRCNQNGHADYNGRCKIHHNSLLRNGPHTTARNELKYVQKKELNQLEGRFVNELNQEQNNDKRLDIYRERNVQVQELRARHSRQQRELEVAQQEEIRRTGVDPDHEPQQRRRQAAQLREQRRNQEMVERVNQMRNNILAEQAAALAGIVAQHQHADPNQNLRAFVNDRQNVHTTYAVKQTKDIVERILKIPVPEEYRWNMTYCSKTPGEIITECRLTPRAAWQMQAKYSQDENIYEMGNGIYGKALDGVWQYTKSSKEKADIISALRQELEDSIGMCAQGNLSRICNILAGFMDGIGSQESLAEILGRELPLLMQIESAKARMKEAINLMSNNNVPRQEWLTWIEPLFYDMEDEDEKEEVFELLA